MNREEEIKKAGSEYTEDYGCFNCDLGDVGCGFVDGAKWADEHLVKFWHKVADGDLPSEPKGDEFDMPFIVDTNGKDVLFAYYAHKEDEESPEFYDDCELPLDVMYWAEIPKLPENNK